MNSSESSSSASLILPSSSTASQNSSPCSMKQNGGGSCLAPMMEIREMPGFCNSCVVPDKFWSHHHHHPTSMVSTNAGRHTSVYPQVFYTPPAPQPQQQSYSNSSANVPQAVVGHAASQQPNDWNCPSAPTHSNQSHGEVFSHFIYHQYSSQQDYSTFLNACYETDSPAVAVVGGPSGSFGPVPSQPMNSFDGTNPNINIPHTLTLPPQVPVPAVPKYGPMNSFAHSSKLYDIEPNLGPLSDSNGTTQKYLDIPSSLYPHSTKNHNNDDKSDDDETREVISIDDESSVSVDEGSIDINLKCALCQKLIEHSSILPQNAPSPQLSKILDNIDVDDDELDISVCSGDIEIGGIEDEMIQQAAEQQEINAVKVSISRLAQLLGVPISLLSDDLMDDNPEVQPANLCFKCKKLVGVAESLEKQLASVLASLKEPLTEQCEIEIKQRPLLVSTSTQTDPESIEIPYSNESQINCRVLLIKQGEKRPILRENRDQNLNNDLKLPERVYLCHECGLVFRTGRNLGKHFRRKHDAASQFEQTKIPCNREYCDTSSWGSTAQKIHLRTHTSEKPFYCANCFKLFTTKSNLTAHQNSQGCHKTIDIPNPAECVQSNSENIVNGVLKDTSKHHCENCGLNFRSLQRYRLHSQKKCCKQNVLACRDCGKLFAKQSELRSHEMIHAGTKRFSCDICGQSFATQGNRRVHQRTHSTEKRFKCQHCRKSFTRKQTLQVHVMNKHEENAKLNC